MLRPQYRIDWGGVLLHCNHTLPQPSVYLSDCSWHQANQHHSTSYKLGGVLLHCSYTLPQPLVYRSGCPWHPANQHHPSAKWEVGRRSGRSSREHVCLQKEVFLFFSSFFQVLLHQKSPETNHIKLALQLSYQAHCFIFLFSDTPDDGSLRQRVLFTVCTCSRDVHTDPFQRGRFDLGQVKSLPLTVTYKELLGSFPSGDFCVGTNTLSRHELNL